MTETEKQQRFEELRQKWLILAALLHDLDHLYYEMRMEDIEYQIGVLEDEQTEEREEI